MKTASNVLIMQDGMALAVSRRNDPTKWGLPGGKVDPGESSIEAALRELREEAGVALNPHEVMPILSQRSEGDVNFWTTTYLFVGNFRIKPEWLRAEEGLLVAWMPLPDLANPLISPFAEYNKRVLNHYLQYMDE